MRPIRRIVMLLPLLLVAGCSTMKPSDFAGSEPRLDLFAYFEGKTRAWGIFEGRSGELKRQFTVDILGVVEGDRLTLTEDFVYADGETQQRIWVIDRLDDGAEIQQHQDAVRAGAADSEHVLRHVAAQHRRGHLDFRLGQAHHVPDLVHQQSDHLVVRGARKQNARPARGRALTHAHATTQVHDRHQQTSDAAHADHVSRCAGDLGDRRRAQDFADARQLHAVELVREGEHQELPNGLLSDDPLIPDFGEISHASSPQR